MNIKELLENEEIKEALELELNGMLADRVKALEESQADLNKQKKQNEREAFIARKALVHKVGLYEKHLKEHYEAQFAAFTKRLASDTFTYVQENLDKTVKAVATDAKANSKAAQIQEALSQTVRILAPHMDLSEALQVSNSDVDKLRAELNTALKAVKTMEETAKKQEIEHAVVQECVELPAEDRKLFTESMRLLNPVSAADVKAAAKNVKQVINKRKADALLETANQILAAEGTEPVVESTNIKLSLGKKKPYDMSSAL